MKKYTPASFSNQTTKTYSATNLRSSLTHYKQPSQIPHIINSLQYHIRQLKAILLAQNKQKHLEAIKGQRIQGRKSSFNGKRVLKRNEFKNHLNTRRVDEIASTQKMVADIFQVRNSYLKSQGRLTNNVVELYQYYKKYIEKPDKSTRIMASMQMSNTANSLQCQKQSLLKHSHSLNQKQINKNKEGQQLIEASNYDRKPRELQTKVEGEIKLNGQRVAQKDVSQKAKYGQYQKIVDKRSLLALDLLNKGCYNMQNLAKMLHSKKYKLSKSKQYQLNKNSPIQPCKSNQQNHSLLHNINSHNIKNSPPKCDNNTIDLNNLKKSKQLNFIQRDIRPDSKKKQDNSIIDSSECKVVEREKKEKDYMKAQHLKERSFGPVSHNQSQHTQLKIDNFITLNESPILLNKNTDFAKSKYYVQPIPNKQLYNMAKSPTDIKSISLKSNSRIIDVDSLPFEL